MSALSFVALTSTALGACVGATLALTGAGGTIIAVPLLMTPAGLWTARHVPNTPLTVLFAAVLAYVAVQMYRRARGSQGPSSSW